MIKAFFGEDRVKAKQEISKALGDNYEVIDCAELSEQDLPSIFLGATFFDAGGRKIMLRDFTANKAISEHFVEHFDEFKKTSHSIVMFESKLDKRSVFYKSLKDKLEFKEFSAPAVNNFSRLMDIYRAAKVDGKKAVDLLRKIEHEEEPIMFFGFIVSQAMKDFAARPGVQEKKALKTLAEIDLKMKSSSVDLWLLVESALLTMGK